MPPKKKKSAYSVAPVVRPGVTLTDFNNRSWKLGKDFARGGFGRIYTATKINGKNDTPNKVVVKMEPVDNGPLYQETHVFQRMAKPEMLQLYQKSKKLKFLGIPTYLSSGTLTYKQAKQRFLVIPQYGATIESVQKELKPPDVFRIGLTVLNALQYLHSVDYVHADVKGDNLLFADQEVKTKKQDYSRVVLVDYGIAKRLSEQPEYCPNPKKAHDGTLIFTSLDAHKGCSPSYRGDIEILGYNLLYWLSGCDLPWIKSGNTPAKVHAEKESFAKNIKKSVKSPLDASNVAQDVDQLLKIAYQMEYAEKPDFGRLSKLMNSALNKAESKGKKSGGSGSSSSGTTSSPSSKPIIAAKPPRLSGNKKQSKRSSVKKTNGSPPNNKVERRPNSPRQKKPTKATEKPSGTQEHSTKRVVNNRRKRKASPSSGSENSGAMTRAKARRIE